MDINKILADVILGIITVVVPALSVLLAKLIVSAIKNSESKSDDRLAAIAVAWAEDKLGSGNGNDKLSYAIDFLVNNSKGKMSSEQADKLVRAAYQGSMGELRKLKNPPAPSTTTP